MGPTIGSVKNHILQLHKICGVHTTRELLRVLVTENLVTVEECPALEYLPQRGRHILDLLSQGNSRPQVAQMLGITVSGVKKHCERLVDGNGCASLYELIARYNISSIIQKRNEDAENSQDASRKTETL